jgi:hypothetical protein
MTRLALAPTRAQLRSTALAGCEQTLAALDNLDEACLSPLVPEPAHDARALAARRAAVRVRRAFDKAAAPELRALAARQRGPIGRTQILGHLTRWSRFVEAVVNAVQSHHGANAEPGRKRAAARAAVWSFIRGAERRGLLAPLYPLEIATLDVAIDVLVSAAHRVSRRQIDWRVRVGRSEVAADPEEHVRAALWEAELDELELLATLQGVHDTLSWLSVNRRGLAGLVDGLLVALDEAEAAMRGADDSVKREFAAEIALVFLGDERLITPSERALVEPVIDLGLEVLVSLSDARDLFSSPIERRARQEARLARARAAPLEPRRIERPIPTATRVDGLLRGVLWLGALVDVAAGAVLLSVGPMLAGLLGIVAPSLLVRAFGLLWATLGAVHGLAARRPRAYPSLVGLAAGLRCGSAALLVVAVVIGEASGGALLVAAAAEFVLGVLHAAYLTRLQRAAARAKKESSAAH